MDTATDELIRTDAAFADNRLLSTLSNEARGLIEPLGEMFELRTGEVVLEAGAQVRSSLFPVGSTMISMTVELSGGRGIVSHRGAAAGSARRIVGALSLPARAGAGMAVQSRAAAIRGVVRRHLSPPSCRTPLSGKVDFS